MSRVTLPYAFTYIFAFFCHQNAVLACFLYAASVVRCRLFGEPYGSPQTFAAFLADKVSLLPQNMRGTSFEQLKLPLFFRIFAAKVAMSAAVKPLRRCGRRSFLSPHSNFLRYCWRC